MDFEWAPAEKEIFDRHLALAREEIDPVAARRGYDELFDADELRRCGGLGLLGLCVPERFGGGGRSLLATAYALEGFATGCADLGLAFAAAAHLFACAMPIAEYGGDELRRRLPDLCAGRRIGGNAITEIGAGSDAFALETRAVRDGDAYLLDGSKSFVTNAPIADLLVVYAKTAPEHGVLGVTAFAVETTADGVTVGAPFAKMGLCSIPTSTVTLEACRVPTAHRLGEEGQGRLVFNRAMQLERAALFAIWLGDMQRQLDRVVAHARERRQFGRPIAKNQAVAHRIANMKLRLESARLLLWRACWLIDQGRATEMDSALAKLATSEAAVQSGIDCVRLFGGPGIQSATGVERGLRDAMAATIASGTSDMQRELIALGLGL